MREAQLLCEFRFVGVVEHSAPPSIASYVLVGMEAGTPQIAAQAPIRRPAQLEPDRERGILDDHANVLACEAVQGHPCPPAGRRKCVGSIRAGGRRDRSRGLRQIDVAGGEVTIDEPPVFAPDI